MNTKKYNCVNNFVYFKDCHNFRYSNTLGLEVCRGTFDNDKYPTWTDVQSDSHSMLRWSKHIDICKRMLKYHQYKQNKAVT
jgi:hypothetical protein